MTISCYFAHPCDTKGSEEEKRIKMELKLRGVNVHDPFENEEKILKKYEIDDYYNDPRWQIGRDIWTSDIGMIKKCSMLLAYIPDYGCLGTAAELATAYENRKFIQIISPIQHPMFSVYSDPEHFFKKISDWENWRPFKWKT